MRFNLGEDHECMECKLESLSGEKDLEIECIKFNSLSIANLEDILKRGVTKKIKY